MKLDAMIAELRKLQAYAEAARARASTSQPRADQDALAHFRAGYLDASLGYIGDDISSLIARLERFKAEAA